MRRFLALILTFAALTSASFAATRDEQTKACKGDALHFCATDIPDEQKITACMKQHYAELSPQCQAMFEAPPHHGARAKPQ
jgi:hypothetical protein